MANPCVLSVLLILLITLRSGACADECVTSRCAPDGPDIKFPFRKSDQPGHCGYRGFVLSCVGNKTVIELPFAGRLTLISIFYYAQTVVLDPKSYPPATFLNLNLSNCPFETTNGDDYVLVNCSSEPPSPIVSHIYFKEIHCLNSSRHRLFAVARHSIPHLDETCESVGYRRSLLRTWYGFTFGICDTNDDYRYRPSLSWYWPRYDYYESQGGYQTYYSSTTGETITSFHVSRGLATRTIIGISLGISILLLALVAATIKIYLCWRLKRNKDEEDQRKIEKFLQEYKSLNPTRHSYAEVRKITDQFKTKLGEGGYGSVFKGLLPNGIDVAVKILKNVGDNGEEFVNEVCTIGKIHHVNIVRLLGFCADGVRRALIYEFMPNKSLEKFIFSKDDQGPSLDWNKIHQIAIGIARGIEYLHQGCDQRILHFDIKPHNILLDHSLTPKISDFGLAKLCSKEESIVSMTVARGTVGYIAPEVVSRNIGNVSYKSDVYSFGMLLLEMVGRRRNVDATVDNASQVYFPEWIYDKLHQGLDLQPYITSEADANIAKSLALTALWCIQWYPVDRPAMKSVVQMLEGDVESVAMPPNPFASLAPTINSGPVFLTNVQNTKLTAISESDTEHEAAEV